MKIDAHVHCAPHSKCAQCAPEDLPAILKAAGIDGMVLTNHCYHYHLSQFGEDREAQIEAYLDAYHRARAAGEAIGFPVLFGAEICLTGVPRNPEILVYGMSEEQFREGYPFDTRTLEDLFAFCEAHNILMSQAHPMRERQNCQPVDPRYVHAYEVCNPGFDGPQHVEELCRLTEEYGLLQTGGSDLHAAFTAGAAYMQVPDGITTSEELRDAIRAGLTSWTMA